MTFKLNPNFERELRASVEYRMALREVAESVRDAAEGFANHAMPRPGHKRIEVFEDGSEVVVANTNYGGHLEEFGGADVKSPVYAPLRRGVMAAGLHFEGSSR